MLSKNCILLLSVLGLILPLSINSNPINGERNRLNAIPRPDFIENIRKEVLKPDSFEHQTANRAYNGRHYCGHKLIMALAIICNSHDYYDNDSMESEMNENTGINPYKFDAVFYLNLNSFSRLINRKSWYHF